MTKRHLIIPILAIASLTAVGCTKYQIVPADSLNNSNTSVETQNNATNNTNNAVSTTGKITADKAKEIALKHANLNEKDVVFINSHMEYDDGMKTYDVTFYHNLVEYDYTIDANTGNIIEFDNDVEGYIIPQSNANSGTNINNAANSSVANTAKITADKAKEIALKHANLNQKDVTFIKSHLEYDDGMQYYDVEFHHNFIEYSYEIDSQTGAIISHEMDR